MIYTNSDGGSRGNPGPAAIGVIVRNEGTILSRYKNFIGKECTNNEAEYEALIQSLKLVSKHTNKEITCVLDSELVVKQLLGEYKIKNPRMREKFLQVQKLQENFEKITYLHASREDTFQKLADELVNEELNRRGYYKKRTVFRRK